MTAAAALEFVGLIKRFSRTPVLRGVDLTLHRGERLALIGPNGAGKSTLFALAGGQLAPDAGQVWLQGRRIDGLSPQRLRRLGLSRGFQHSGLFGAMSVRDHLRCALLAGRPGHLAFWPALSRDRALAAQSDALLSRLGLAARAGAPASGLSYAERRTLELGLALAGGASVLLLDEPTAGMSRPEAAQAVALVRELTAGCSVLLVEHDMEVVFGLADRVAVLVQGQVIACGPPEAVRADPRVREAYLGAALAQEAADA